MQYKKQGSIVLDLNSLSEGLNFLVPSDWWSGFLTANRNKESHEELQIPEAHPLDFFFDIGIIQNCASGLREWMHSHEHLLKSLQEHANQITEQVNQEVRQISLEGVEEGSRKRNRPFHEWWDFDVTPVSKSYNKILLSPSINRSAYLDLFAGFEWKVVSPRLYRLICQGQFNGKDEHYRDFIIGIPVFLSAENIALGQNEMDYVPGPQIKTTVYFYNTMGLRYAFLGSVEEDVALDGMLGYLYEGMYKMAVHGFTVPSQCFRNQLRLLNDQIYCNFDDEDQNCSKLKWEPFNKQFSEPPLDGVEVIELSSYCKGQAGDEVVEVFVETLKSSKPVKKQKRDPQSEGSVKTAKKRAGYNSQQRLKARHERFRKNREAHPEIFQQVQITATTQEPHFSTEEQTPSVIFEVGGQQLQQLIFQTREENRIYYPIWRNFHSVHSLAKLADLKMNESLPLPFTSPNKKIIKTKEGKRVLITTTSNQLVSNENGETVEMDKVEMHQKGIPEEMIKLLQSLALQIRGEKRQMNIQLLIKEEELEAAKEKIDIESRTCKNQEEELDDLDEVQSREC